MSAPGRRHIQCGACVIGALVLFLCGWLMPIHLRAIDVAVVQAAGRISVPLTLPTPDDSRLTGFPPGPVTPYLIRFDARQRALGILRASPIPAVQELLRCRGLTNTVLFPPSSSASGQAFDVAVALSGMLIESGHVTAKFTDAILEHARGASHGGNTVPLEEILMDEMSLGQRFDWPQLVAFTDKIEDAQTLSVLSDRARNAGPQLPALFTAVQTTQQPAAVANYLTRFNRTGLQDLAASEHYGQGGVLELLRSGERLYAPTDREAFTSRIPTSRFFHAASEWALHIPAFALTLKWFFYLTGGFLIALGFRMSQLAPVNLSGSASFARELIFATGVLFVALLVGEPFLAQDNQAGAGMPFRLHLPMAGIAANQTTHVKQTFMNTPNMTASLLTLFLFFVLQALIYLACLSRLNETLRQNTSARMKLKLLENEEHLFDAGLYLGFVGTIICLILVSLGVLQFSLMAAYSSTSFGIIFVSVLKIFKVRPARRRLLLQAEAENPGSEPAARPVGTTFAPVP